VNKGIVGTIVVQDFCKATYSDKAVVFSILTLLCWHLLFMTFVVKIYLIIRNAFHCIITL
jgi:hypothetical protein